MDTNSPIRTIAIVTGSRADFGLLRPVMRAIGEHPALRLKVIVCGAHLLPPARTIEEVEAEFEIDHIVHMMEPGTPLPEREDTTQRVVLPARLEAARALGRGVLGLAEAIDDLRPDVVVVLGDQIEAFAAASAASVAGIHVAHLHGGDRAVGIADEALRHAVTKLAHIQLPATSMSAERIIAMGEEPRTVHLVGSPAIDDLDSIPDLDDQTYTALGRPEIVFLMHPVGDADDVEERRAAAVLDICQRFGNVLALHPNFDPGRAGILRAIRKSACPERAHLPRRQFIGLLRNVNLIVGNSSAGLIECAALGVRAINIGSRQSGREMPGNVIDIEKSGRELRIGNRDSDVAIGEPGPASVESGVANDESREPNHESQIPSLEAIDAAIFQYFSATRWIGRHPYGDGHTGERTARILATFDPEKHPLRKKNSY